MGLLLGVLFFVYLLWTTVPEVEEEPGQEEGAPEQSSAEERPMFALAEDPLPGREPEGPGDFYRELGEFFQNLIQMVKATFVAHSSALFLKERSRDKLRVQYCVSEHPGLKPGNLVEIEGTLPGSVFRNQTGVLENNLPERGQAAGYYANPVAVKSFMGVPVRIRGEVRGVLSVDSLVAGDFSQNDLELLRSYERLISQGISLLGERERSQLVSRFLQALELFLATVDQDLSEENVSSALGKACRALFEFDRLTVARLHGADGKTARIVKVLGQRDEMGEGFVFPVDDGLMGWVLRKGKPLLLDDLEKGDLFRPRYTRTEKTNYGLRSFLGVPIRFFNRPLGAVSLESRKPDFYSEWDQYALQLLALNAGLALVASGPGRTPAGEPS